MIVCSLPHFRFVSAARPTDESEGTKVVVVAHAARLKLLQDGLKQHNVASAARPLKQFVVDVRSPTNGCVAVTRLL